MGSNTPNLQYTPSLAGNAFYLALFAVCLCGQIYLGIKRRTWVFMGFMVCALILEAFGYAGRLLLHADTNSQNGFLMYLVSLTMGGAFFAAAIYVTLAHIIVVFGEHISRLRPRTYTILFITFDFFSLLLQAVGGGIASSAETEALADVGVNVMIAGLSCQVVSLLIFITFALEFAFCAWKADHFDPLAADLRKSWLFRSFLGALAFGTLTLFVRSVFRVAELSEGFDGHLANDQVTFMVLEGAMVACTALSLTLLHPGVSFQGKWAAGSFTLGGKPASSRVAWENAERTAEEKNMSSGMSSPPNEAEVGLGGQPLA